MHGKESDQETETKTFKEGSSTEGILRLWCFMDGFLFYSFL